MLHRGLHKKVQLISLLTVIIYALNICLSGFTAKAQASGINPPQDIETQTKLNFSSTSPSEADKNRVLEKASKLNLPFFSNQGQYDERVSFIANTFAGTLFVTREGELVYSLPVAEKREKDPASGEVEASSKTKTKGWVLKEKLIGAAKTEPQGFDKAPTKVNYFTGNDKSKWKQNIDTYSEVNMGEIYPGIYLNLRSSGNNVEKVFTVKPGGEVKNIRLKMEGANSLKVNNKGELEVGTGLGHVRFTKPVAYQENNGKKEYVQVNYNLAQDTYGFAVGDYDKSRPLVIDPLLASTFIGGSGSDTIYSVTFDRTGNVYVTGKTQSSNYPTTPGAYDTSSFFWDAVVSKFDANLQQLLASTFISGYGYATAYSIAIDKTGNVYIAGGTDSAYYPTTAGAYSQTYISGSTNVFVSKFNASLSNLLASTYISRGGVSSLAIDASGNVIIAGSTGYTTYPTTATAFEPSYNGGNSDGFVSKLDPNLSNLLASTFIGGSGADKVRSLAISLEGNIYVTGATDSTNYPTTGFAFDRSYNGGVNDAFVSKLSFDLTSLAYSTYIGGTYNDEAFSLALSSDGTVYVAGTTTSSDYPTTSGAYKRTKWYDNDVFISRLDSKLRLLFASTFIGGTRDESGPISLAVNSAGNIYVSGYTVSSDYPITPGAYDPVFNGSTISWDLFASKLDANLRTLLASTYIGGSNLEYVYSLALNRAGDVYVVGETQSSNFPTTANGYDPGFNGDRDGFVTKLSADLSANTVLSGANASERMVKFDRNSNSAGESLYADPVDAATGAHIIERTLLNVNGAQPVSFRVRYNSLLLNEGSLGSGWSHDLETRLVKLQDGDIDIYWSANRVNRFINNGSDQFSSSDLTTRLDTLVKNPDSSYRLTRKDQSVYLFNQAGQLIEQANGHGQHLTMAYDAEGRLVSVVEPVSGSALTFQYNLDGLISEVTDGLNRQVALEYDANHNLTKITDAKGQSTTYIYNAQGRVLTATDAEGVQIFSNTYDEQGRVATQDDAITTNQLARFNYDETTEPGKVITTVYDRNGQSRVLTHDSNYQLLSLKDELGNIINTYTYDADGNRTAVTDASGNTTTFAYDTRGNLLSTTDPAGNLTRMTYNDRNNLLTVENAVYKKTTYTYDANNNVTSVTDPLGNIKTLTYNGNGLILTEATPRGGTTTYAYVYGRVYSVTNAAGNTTTFGYDAVGRLVSKTDAAGKTTTMAYDNADNLLSVTDPLGNRVSFTYNSRNDKLSTTDAKGKITSFTYNGNGKLTSVANAVYNETRYEYDGEDRLIRLIDARGNTTNYSYDAKGRLIATTDPLGNTSTIQYDALDRVIGKTGALGNKILTITYDALSNPVSVTDAVYCTVYNHYDHLNRLDRVTDPMGRIYQFNYDDLNRLLSTVDPLAGISSQGFDADGNRTALVDPNNNQTGFSFDNAGRLTAQTFAVSNQLRYNYNARELLAQITNGRSQATDYQYDDAGRLISFTDPTGTVAYTYDANGNVLTTTDATGIITREYDALNRVVAYTDTKGNIIRYDYDAVGNLVTLTYPGGKQVTYGYDANNRITSVTDWANRRTTYEYDANGRLVKTLRPNGTVLTLNYDAADQLVQQKDVDSSGSIIAQYNHTYDAAGNVTEERSALAQQPFTIPDNRLLSYDADDRLVQQKNVDSNGNVIAQYNYTYDSAGNVTQGPDTVMTYTYDDRLATYNGQAVVYDDDGNMTTGPLGGNMLNFNYDSRNRITNAGSVSYIYDAENNRISVTEGVYETRYVINPNASLSQVLIKTDAQGNQTFYVYGLGLIGQEDSAGVYRTYHFDRRGSTVALTDNNGAVTDRFQYSPYGALVNRSGITSTPFLYNGRDGVMTDSNGLYYMRARYYNPEITRFMNRDVIQGSINEGQSLNRYAYVNGNPVSYVDPFGLSRDSDGFNAKDAASLGINFIPVAGEIKSFIEIFTGRDLVSGRSVTVKESVLGAIPLVGKVKKSVKFARYADEVIDVTKGTGKFVKKADNVIQVTKDGVALPPGRKIPKELVENPHRPGSYGKINLETGKYKEALRIDPPTPRGKPGPEYSHYHLDGGKEHLSPRPGDNDPWPWD